MDTNKRQYKIQDTSPWSLEEVFTELDLKMPKRGNKKGSCIMLAPKQLQNKIHMETEKYIVEKECGNVKVVRSTTKEYAVLDANDNIVVPFGKYAWIDGFDHGLARVKSKEGAEGPTNTVAINIECNIWLEGKDAIEYVNKDMHEHPEKYKKWGIINEQGEEVLPLEYTNIWNFYKKGRVSTRVEKGSQVSEVYFRDLLKPTPIADDIDYTPHSDPFYDYVEHQRYIADSYMDAFEDDPDALWNID